jgi:hypothetical protein
MLCRVGKGAKRQPSRVQTLCALAHAILEPGLTALSGYRFGNGEVAVAHPTPADMLMRD